ncbi:hypothetical protein ABPG75_001655 [Micractinium tetrahymenae]
MGPPRRAGQREEQLRQQEQPQQQAGEQQQPVDCLRCRVVGTGVCLAASAYLAASNWAALPGSTGKAHRVVMLGAAAGFLALGIARAVI